MGSQRLSWWFEWPAGIVRSGVAFLVAVTVVAVLVRYPTVLRQAGRDAARNSDLSYSDREIAGGNGVVADQNAVYAARGIIPESETYKVVVDPGFQGGSSQTVPFVDSYYRYFLVPRRPAEAAQWLICYACDLEPYGSRAQVVWEGDEDVSIVRITE
ncbi:MAG TPA: hypothetical protein VJ745_07840 [Gaiellaceae bacterium]|nr:hypothetical protein [Gaiellaceae bacterium]